MDKLQDKATELIAMAESQGITAKISYQSEHYIYLDYSDRISSHISYTYTGKVSVKSWEDWGYRRNAISTKNLATYLQDYAQTKKDLAQLKATRELEKAGA
jgi:hypothetical protein